MKKPIRISITTGDIDGIGTEITSKALAKLKPQKNILFYVWRSSACPKKHLFLIDKYFKRHTVNSWPEALKVKFSSHKDIVDIHSNLTPAHWFETSSKASFYGHLDGIVTAPLSKTSIISSGMNDLGHTEILKRITGEKDLFMVFSGKHFNVLLVTGHISIKDIPTNFNKLLLEKAIFAANNFVALFGKQKKAKPMALVGINPHKGESGLIGNEEEMIFKDVITNFKKNNILIEGPLSPDSAYLKTNWNKFSMYIAPYHDQGLIPFKMAHFKSPGVHCTVGLNFIRTSVDHGTAKDIFGKNRANPTSMYEALKTAIRFCKINHSIM